MVTFAGDGAEIRIAWMLLGDADRSAHLKFVARLSYRFP
jgi:hypothetical protein